MSRLPLAPLSQAAVAELAGSSDVDPAALFRLTGGNPFFLTEVLADGGAEVPGTVRDAVLARVSRLPAPARRALELAAVIGSPLDLDLLHAAAGADGPHLDGCIAAGMVRADRTGVAFRHELARIAVMEAIPPARRAALHRVVLGALLAAGHAGAARLAHHAEAAGDRSATRTFAERAAAEAARLGAHREAAAQYRRALRALGRTGDATRARLLARCSQECALSDQIVDARTHAEEALLLWRGMGDRPHEGDALRWLSSLAWMSDRAADAVRIGRESITLLDRLPEGLALARACATLGQQYTLTHALDDALPLLIRASELAAGLAAPEIAARAGIDLGLAYTLRRDADGEVQLEAAVQRARELGLDLDAARGMYQLGRAAWGFDRHAQAEQWFLATEAFCIERGLEHVRDFALALRANVLLDRGEWRLAEDLARDVWRRTTPASSTARTVAVGIVLGKLHARRGTVDRDEASDVASRRGVTIAEHAVMIGLPAARAEAAWLAGRPAAVVAELLAAREVARADPVTGDRDLAEICWWLRAAGHGYVRAEGTGPFAMQTAGDWRSAADGWEALGRPYHRAQALPAAAEEPSLRVAFEICRELGAIPLGRIVTRRLRALGIRNIPRLAPRPPGPSNAAGLTAREVEVLALLADGLRDADIAGHLVISQRTVHHHVGEILRKLDARSRTAAVAVAARMGLDGKER